MSDASGAQQLSARVATSKVRTFGESSEPLCGHEEGVDEVMDVSEQVPERETEHESLIMDLRGKDLKKVLAE